MNYQRKDTQEVQGPAEGAAIQLNSALGELSYEEQVRAIQPEMPVMFNAGEDGKLPYEPALQRSQKAASHQAEKGGAPDLSGFKTDCRDAHLRAAILAADATAYATELGIHYQQAYEAVQRALAIPDEVDATYDRIVDLFTGCAVAFSAGALAPIAGGVVARGLGKLFTLPSGGWVLDGAKNLAKFGIKGGLGALLPEGDATFSDHEPFAPTPLGFVLTALNRGAREESAVLTLIEAWIQAADEAMGGAEVAFDFSFDPVAAVNETLLVAGEPPSPEVPSTMAAELERMLWMQFCSTNLRVRGGGGHPARWNLSRAAIRHIDDLASSLGEDWEQVWVPQELQTEFRRRQRSEHDWDADWGG